eukprot:scaffold8855_cov125-Isochrysis_galbana.AAC.1
MAACCVASRARSALCALWHSSGVLRPFSAACGARCARPSSRVPLSCLHLTFFYCLLCRAAPCSEVFVDGCSIFWVVVAAAAAAVRVSCRHACCGFYF